MSSGNKKILLFLLSIALVGCVVYYFVKEYFPKYKWYENYSIKNDQPYGLKFFHELLSSNRDKKDFVLINQPPKNQLHTNDSSGLYIFVGKDYYLDSISSKALVDFVKKGNNAFISSVGSTHSLFKLITKERSIIYYVDHSDSILKIDFDSTQHFQFEYKLFKKLAIYNWAGIDSAFFADSLAVYGFQKVSTFKNYYVDCIKIKCGLGYFVFQFNPLFFSNYSLSKKEGLNYVNALLSDFNKKTIYWDEFSRGASTVDYSNPENQTPLRYILSEKSLRWTWYLICIFVLLFVIMNSKRKQAYIPLMPQKRNTTIEYINSISTLYYKSDSFIFLADEILKQFLSFVRTKYGISSNLDKSEIAKLLAPKSGVDEATINKLFRHYMGVRYSPVKETKDLIEFYKLTEYFYKNCK